MFNLAKKLILIGLISGLPLFCFAYENPGAPSGFVNDFARVFSVEQKNELEQKLSAFERETSNEISVVTVESLQEDTIENFAVELFKDWGIGKTGEDNGILVLIALQEKQMRIEVGYGLEGALTDAQSFWIIDEVMKPAFRQNDYYAGVNGAVEKIIGATKGEFVPEQKEGAGRINAKNFEWIIGLVVFLFMWLASILGRSKSWWAGGVLGGIAGIVLGLIFGFLFVGVIALAALVPLGLLFDFLVSQSYQKAKAAGLHYPWWIGGGSGRGGSGGGFSGFGGGSSGGGGASGGW